MAADLVTQSANEEFSRRIASSTVLVPFAACDVADVPEGKAKALSPAAPLFVVVLLAIANVEDGASAGAPPNVDENCEEGTKLAAAVVVRLTPANRPVATGAETIARRLAFTTGCELAANAVSCSESVSSSSRRRFGSSGCTPA